MSIFSQTARNGSMLFQSPKVNSLIAEILRRDLSGLKTRLQRIKENTKTIYETTCISGFEAMMLKNLDKQYGNNTKYKISRTPILLALALQNASDPNTMTPTATPAEVVTALLEDSEALGTIAKETNLPQPSGEEIQNFADQFSKDEVGSVVQQSTLVEQQKAQPKAGG